MALLKLENIYKSFKQGSESYDVLKGINLTINKGEVISIIGPSGSGKSTFLVIAGLLDSATKGNIFFKNTDCSKFDESKRTLFRRNHIGFIYQFHHLLPEFTAFENVMIPGMIKSENHARVKEKSLMLLEDLGLSHRLNNLPSELSGGEQQRVAIARSMINSPDLILADEPTGNLDPQNSLNVMNILLGEAKKRDVALIIVTHNLELAKKTDKILTLKDGKIYS